MDKQYKILLIVLLVFGLSACGALGPRTFNADASEESPFSFEYPRDWEVIYDDELTWALEDIENIKLDENGNVVGASMTIAGIGFFIIEPEVVQGKPPREILTERKQSINEAIAELEARGETDKAVTDFNETLPSSSATEIYQDLTTMQVCDKEIVMLKSHVLWGVLRQYEAMMAIDDHVIQIVGFPGAIEENEFDSMFEAVVCSLEVHESE